MANVRIHLKNIFICHLLFVISILLTNNEFVQKRVNTQTDKNVYSTKLL